MSCYLLAFALTALATTCNGFTTTATQAKSIRNRVSAVMMLPTPTSQDNQVYTADQSRRSVLSSFLAATTGAATVASILFPGKALAEPENMERGGVKLTPFNSLAFNYREGESPTVDASDIKEASIPYSEFLEKLESGQVVSVDFLAPNGDAAYATLKSTVEGDESSTIKENNKPIRIGEGYPVEDPTGWSSPAFVIKAVAKKGIPYKFVVPSLSDSFKI